MVYSRYFLLVIFIFACQGDILRVAPNISIAGELTGQNTAIMYYRFVGSNRSLPPGQLFGGPGQGDEAFFDIDGIGYPQWNNCIEFTAPNTVSSNDFATYSLRSTIYSDPAGQKDVFFPNQIITTNNMRESIFTDSYFMFRYDILNEDLDNISTGPNSLWYPSTQSPSIPTALQVAKEDNNGTLQGLSVFHLVFLRNYVPDIISRQVEFNFGPKIEFENTATLDALSPSGLRKKYEQIAGSLSTIDLVTQLALTALGNVTWIDYYQTTDPITSGSTHSSFRQNRINKTCP